MTFRTFIPAVTYFGLTNAPPTFQRIVHQDLEPLFQKYPRSFGNYLDDTWIITDDNQEGVKCHRLITQELLQLLKDKSYFLKASKCEFEVREMDLLGWRVGNGEIRIDLSKIAGLKEWPLILKSKLHVQKTMGILNYIRPSIKGYAEMAQPITNSIKKENEPFTWTTECRNALERLVNRDRHIGTSSEIP